MTVTEAPTRSLGRPAATPEDLEVAAFRRIADLASSVLGCIRKPGRIRYRSERQLRAWLAEDGISFTTGDIAPALTLLEARCIYSTGHGEAECPTSWMAHKRR